MTARKITVIDTGVANIASVLFALRRLGADCLVSADPADLARADRLVLPGVGSAAAAMAAIRAKGLDGPIRAAKQPLLGICLGMQMLAERSEESMSAGGGTVPCLGLVPGRVTLLREPGLILPHMGWNQISHDGTHPLLRGIPDGAYFYFVHSYALGVTERTVATTTYGRPFTAVVAAGNFFGTQFHPEKSGPAGHLLLKNFLEL